MGYRFFAIPSHRLTEREAPLALDEVVEPELPFVPEAIERAFNGAEFRDERARDRLRRLMQAEEPAAGASKGPAAVFARPPDDLPALLRLADQLERQASDESGEKALVWRCECGTRYAVPIALVRQVSIRCERCGLPVELTPARSLGEESLLDPAQTAVNAIRRQLAMFFREAMARGWPVLVCTTD